MGKENRQTEEKVGEQEMAEMVALHHHLEVVLGQHQPIAVGNTSVVDEDVQSRLFPVDHLGKLSHRVQTGQVQFANDHVRVPCRGYDFVCNKI